MSGMNDEFFEALQALEKEKNIPEGYLAEKIAGAITIAVKHNYKAGDNAIVELDPKKKLFRVALRKTVVESVDMPSMEIELEQARQIDPSVELGDTVDIELDTHDFGRIAAQTAKHVIRQGIKEVEREVITDEVMSRQHEMVTGTITRIDAGTGSAYVDVGRTEAIMPSNEQIPGEVLREGQLIKVYVADVKNNEKGPRTIVSRTHPGVIRRMFELEVPEIFDGTVEIMGIAREPGSRTKVAVTSKKSRCRRHRLLHRPEGRQGRQYRKRAQRREDRPYSVFRGYRRVYRRGARARQGHRGLCQSRRQARARHSPG